MCTIVEGMLWRTESGESSTPYFIPSAKVLTAEESAAADEATQMAVEMGG